MNNPQCRPLRMVLEGRGVCSEHGGYAISSSPLDRQPDNRRTDRNKSNNNQKQLNMIKKQLIYESPEVKVTEVLAEGVLCMSGNHEGWLEEDIDW